MNIGFIGVGNMNSAIIDGLISSGYNQRNIHITNRTENKMDKYRNSRINCYSTSPEVIANSDVIILGIKPGDYKQWLEQYTIGNKILISIAAGITSEFLSKYVTNFVITMPNTPSSVGHGTTLIIDGHNLTDEIVEIFNAIGSTVIIEEESLPVYMLLTGCSPAYFFTFIKQLVSQFKEYDIPEEVSNRLLIEVMEGSLAMLKGDISASELADNVCSPGGVTIEVAKMLDASLAPCLNQGFKNALIRNEELKN